jgi:hypothetical protein
MAPCLQQLETDIATTRADIARLKQQIPRLFVDPTAFATVGDELRHASDKLTRLEADLAALRLDARDDAWLHAQAGTGSGASSPLRRSAASFRKRPAPNSNPRA